MREITDIAVLAALVYIAFSLHSALRCLRLIERHLGNLTLEDNMDMALDLYKETHGAIPVSATQKVAAIREMRVAMREMCETLQSKPPTEAV